VNLADCQKLIDSYVNWLRHGLCVEEVGKACELTTPFLDRHNDHLQVYAVQHNGNIVLSDDGYILSDLRTSGLEVDTPKRKMVLDSVLNGLGVRVEKQSVDRRGLHEKPWAAAAFVGASDAGCQRHVRDGPASSCNFLL